MGGGGRKTSRLHRPDPSQTGLTGGRRTKFPLGDERKKTKKAKDHSTKKNRSCKRILHRIQKATVSESTENLKNRREKKKNEFLVKGATIIQMLIITENRLEGEEALEQKEK